MRTFQQFLEQVGSSAIEAKKAMRDKLAYQRSVQRLKQGYWRQREAIRTKHRQDSEMHNDMERRHALPE